MSQSVARARIDGTADGREIGKALRLLDASAPRADNLPVRAATTAGTAWTSLCGLPIFLGFTVPVRLELAGEIQWQWTLAAQPSAAAQPFELRVVVDRVVAHNSEIQPLQARLLKPVPATIATGSLGFMAPLQRLAVGRHAIDVQIKAPSGTTWTVLNTSVLRYATYREEN